jgi:hypothetical protein
VVLVVLDYLQEMVVQQILNLHYREVRPQILPEVVHQELFFQMDFLVGEEVLLGVMDVIDTHLVGVEVVFRLEVEVEM